MNVMKMKNENEKVTKRKNEEMEMKLKKKIEEKIMNLFLKSQKDENLEKSYLFERVKK